MARAAGVRRPLSLLATLAVALVVANPVAATARSGTWGAARVPYQAGVVCPSGPLTSPLVRWGFGDPNPDFLLRSVSSNGVRDSAQLPVAGVANRFSSAIQPGQYGFTSADDIATYAALLSRYGSAHAAAVALALLAHSDPGRAPSCVTPATAAALVTRAQAQAGPYRLDVSVAQRPVVLGAANSVAVQVTGRTGAGAAGVRVSINASDGVFAGGASTASAVSDANGRASVQFTAPDAAADKELTFDAGASVPVGLEAVTATAQLGQPAYAPVAYADSPQTASGRTSVPVDLTADPHIALSLPASVVVANHAVLLGAQVTGMRGHTGEAHITASGPEPLDRSSLCANVATGADLETAYDSGDIDISADDKIAANAWTPTEPGCYVVRSHVETTNAVPPAQAQGQTSVVTVLDSRGTLSTTHTIIGSGPLTAKLHLDNSYGLTGTAHVRVRGPLHPAGNDCSTMDFSKAPTAATAARPVRGDGDYPVRLDQVLDPGCYEFAGAVDLQVPGSRAARVPIDVASDSQIAYVLQPALRLTGDETSTTSPHSIGTRIEVDGTFGQPGRLQVAMVHAAGGTFGCAGVDYSTGTRESVGPEVAITGDGTYNVRSGTTPKNGCYSLVPLLVMDANKSITASGEPGAEGSTIVAGAGSNGDGASTAQHGGGSSSFGPGVWTAILVYAGIAVVVFGLLLRLATRERGPRTRPSPGFDTLLHDLAPAPDDPPRLARRSRRRHRDS